MRGSWLKFISISGQVRGVPFNFILFFNLFFLRLTTKLFSPLLKSPLNNTAKSIHLFLSHIVFTLFLYINFPPSIIFLSPFATSPNFSKSNSYFAKILL